MSLSPDELKYATTHEWVAVDGEIATLGITDFAVAELTDLTYIDLPEAGGSITKGETFGEVESVKAVSDLYAPVTGEIVEVNNELEDDLAPLSDDAFGAGWLLKVKLSDPSELDALLDRSGYLTHTGQN